MGSKHQRTREIQKSRYEAAAEARISLLREKGLSEEAIKKDSKVRQFKAKVKQIDSAVACISFIQDQKRQLQEMKEKAKEEAAKAEAEAAAKPQKEKKAASDKKPAGTGTKTKEGKKPAEKGGQEAKKKGK
jgi:colicin import membrane protein